MLNMTAYMWAQNHLIQTEDFQIGVQAMIGTSLPQWQSQ
jgi:hypothetical protein